MDPMSTPNIEDTAPVNTTAAAAPAAKKRRSRRWIWILLGILLLIGGVAAGTFTGYSQAVAARETQQSSAVKLKAAVQYQLGLEDMKTKNYENAVKRFEYVINLDPSYPDAANQLALAMLSKSTTATPVPQATVTLTPTPDTRGEQELFAAAKAALAAKDWNKTIETLDSLRKANLTYEAIAVDGMYYVALRNRGMAKVQAGQLEEGMYDMSLAERFGPLDKDADTYRTWARTYIIGASFWELDWVQVINYFQQVYAAVPMLRDGSGMTASERYRKALIAYGDKLVTEEKYCDAQQQYELALQVSPDGGIGQKATQNYKECYPPTPTRAPKTPTPEEITPMPDEPTVMPSETPMPEEPTAAPPDATAPAP